MKTQVKNKVLAILFNSDEMTKESLDTRNDTQIRGFFRAVADKLVPAQETEINTIMLAFPYREDSGKNKPYVVSYDVKTHMYEYERDSDNVDAAQTKLEQSLTKDDFRNMSQLERRQFIKGFMGASTEVVNYDSNLFKRVKQNVFISAEEINDRKNINHYGCIPLTYFEGQAVSFVSKKGQLWRKFDGIALDAQHEPINLACFAISEDDMNQFNTLKRWQRLLVFGKVKETKAFKSDNTYLEFEVDGVLVSKEHGFKDNSSKNGRVELATHTRYTQLGAETHEDEMFSMGADLGLGGIALTDTDSVQAYRTGMNFEGKFNHLKPYYGVELDVVDRRPNFVFNPNDIDLSADNTTYVAFDIETTGLSGVHDQIIQLSAIRFKKTVYTETKGRGKNKREEKYFKYDVIDTVDEFVHINKKITAFTTQLTGITQEKLDKSTMNEKATIQKFYEFIHEYDNTVLVGHNVEFDYNFINYRATELGLPKIDLEVIDTLPIARRFVTGTRSYKLENLAKKLKVILDNAHNSRFDATATGQVWFNLLQVIKYGAVTNEVEPNLEKLTPKFPKADIPVITGLDLSEVETHTDEPYKEMFPSHVSLIAKNQAGIKQIYELISQAHVKYFYKTARVYKDMVSAVRDDGNNVMYGSGDANSELYDVLTRYGYDRALEVAKRERFDYLEILSFKGVGYDKTNQEDCDRYQYYMNGMLKIAEEINAIPVIVGDVHYMTPSEKEVYNIVKGIAPDSEYGKADLSLKSAQELIDEIKDFVGDEQLAEDLVINNTRKVVADVEDDIVPIKSKLTPPRLPGADEELTETAWNKAHELYGQDLPKVITDRIEKELKAIISNGYSVIYLTAKKLVDWSNQTQGYLVGSRGSVGGSLVAFLVGITEVNSLPPHYRSAHGDYLEFVDPIQYEDGFDLPAKDDPNHPGELLIGDGHNCSFEIFAGVAGKKVPDIDLNFASEIQGKAQLELKNIFGEKNVFRVGTIGTIAEKTAFGYVKHYAEEHNLDYSNAKIEYLKDRMVGIKRTSGEHAAGVLIVPQDKDITDFSPYTYPANKSDSEWMTTMFDKNMMHDSLLKMDCLGHVDPTMLHFMKETTGVDPLTLSQLQIEDVAENLYSDYKRIIGMPEFGTKLTRFMVRDTKPTKFSQLVEISGLSHGTDVWAGNAQDLIASGTANLSQVISTRDKILNDTMARGYPFEKAHNLVQIVKKKEKITPDIQKELDDLNLPSWYVPSLEKIQYLFPAAHAVAYTISACRIGWYKMYRPIQFFAGWLTYRFNGDITYDMILNNDYKEIAHFLATVRKEGGKKGDELAPTAGVLVEAMTCANRGYGKEMDIKFIAPTLEQAHSEKWLPNEEDGTIMLPLSKIPGITPNIGENILEYRKGNDTMSKHSADYKEYTGKSIPKKAVQELVKRGLFED